MSCDEQRPCKRCVGRGCGDQCRDGKRKRRGRKRKTPLPDDENSLDDEFDEFEPADKQLKDTDSDTEDEFDDERGACSHGDGAHAHHHNPHAPASGSAPSFNFKLFDDEDEEHSSLSNSSSSATFLKVKSEFEESAPHPSRPTTPALPVPLRNPKLVVVAQNSSAHVESSSPSTNQPSFETTYPSFFEAPSTLESAPASHHAGATMDVDSFFAEPAPCSLPRVSMAFLEGNTFAEPSEACF